MTETYTVVTKPYPVIPINKEEAGLLGSIPGLMVLHNLPFTWTGSSLVKGVEAEDLDLLVYDKEGIIQNQLEDDWRIGGSGGGDSRDFTAYKKYGDTYEEINADAGKLVFRVTPTRPINIILTTSEKYYKDFHDATLILESAQLKEKWQRVELFQYMRDEIPMDAERFVKLSSGDVEDLEQIGGHMPW